jgi:hypothetical protein
VYQPFDDRYAAMVYRRCGSGGLHRAFDLGITHFGPANHYGPPPGSAEQNCGRFLILSLLLFLGVICFWVSSSGSEGPQRRSDLPCGFRDFNQESIWFG